MSSTAVVSLAATHDQLGWPSERDIREPTGAPARAYAALAKAKISHALSKFGDAAAAVIGVLMAASSAETTEAPIAIVVEFPGRAADATIRELQRLAWNFSHSPAVITAEPGLIRVWSCCKAPDPSEPLSSYLAHELGASDLLEVGLPLLERHAAAAMHWVNMVSGRFFLERPEHFERGGRADHTLLENLRSLKAALYEAGLKHEDTCHDLLARIVFVQFLFDRKDAAGIPALNVHKLRLLQADGILAGLHDNLESVLGSHPDTYALFEWLNSRFNGDLFPGKGETADQRAEGWAAERAIVTAEHLALLAQFIRGDIHMPSGQRSLWPQYSFDIIPLEFISSIYEAFVTKEVGEGVHYTPPVSSTSSWTLSFPGAGRSGTSGFSIRRAGRGCS